MIKKIAPLICLVVGLFMEFPLIIGVAYRNIGLVNLNQAGVEFASTVSEATVETAEQSLIRAVELNRQDFRAWRALGMLRLSSGREQAAALAFEKAGETRELVIWGRLASKGEQFQTAILWYDMALAQAPHFGDVWYYRGLALERLSRWDEAIMSYEKGTKVNHFNKVPASTVYYRMGRIYQWAMPSPAITKALAAYEAALEIDCFSNDFQKADTHYKRGELLLWLEQDFTEAIAEFQQALELAPDYVQAHILLGNAYYTVDGDLTRAEATLKHAIALDEYNPHTYFALAEMYLATDLPNKAIRIYRNILDFAPDFQPARDRLSALESE